MQNLVIRAGNTATAGFSLMEMTLVLLILSIIATSGLSIYTDHDNRGKLETTRARLDRIEKALDDFRFSNHRLPCPADASLAESTADFGLEGLLPGNCRDGSRKANFNNSTTASGMVPVHSLNLPNDMAYDGWGRRFAYMVTTKMTDVGAMLADKGADWDGAITVEDAAGKDRTEHAIYALVSYGENGHGAYLASGARRNSGSTNSAELKNAGKNSSFVDNYNSTLVMRRQTENDSNVNNVFDDVVRYRERWSMASASDAYKTLDIRNRLTNISSFLAGYWRMDSGDVWLDAWDFDTTNGLRHNDNRLHVDDDGHFPYGCIPGFALTPDKTLLTAVLDTSPWMISAMWTNRGYTSLKLPSPVPKNGDGFPRLAWSPNGELLAVANHTGNSYRVMFYRRDKSTNTLTFLNGSEGPDHVSVNDPVDVSWSQNGDFVAFASLGNDVLGLYRHERTYVGGVPKDRFIDVVHENVNSICTVVGSCGPGVCTCTAGKLPSGDLTTVQFSSDGTKLLVGGDATRTTLIYDFNPAGPVYLSETKRHSVQSGGGSSSALSHNMKYMVENRNNDWKLYKLNDSTGIYSPVTGSQINCNFNLIRRIKFSPDDSYMVFAHDTSKISVGVINYQTDEVTCQTQNISGNLRVNEIQFINYWDK